MKDGCHGTSVRAGHELFRGRLARNVRRRGLRLVERDGLVLRDVRRSFVLDVLIAASCREVGGILVSRNTGDMMRIASVFAFDFVPPYPPRSRG